VRPVSVPDRRTVRAPYDDGGGDVRTPSVGNALPGQTAWRAWPGHMGRLVMMSRAQKYVGPGESRA
jgi:hypothetical protein